MITVVLETLCRHALDGDTFTETFDKMAGEVTP